MLANSSVSALNSDESEQVNVHIFVIKNDHLTIP